MVCPGPHTHTHMRTCAHTHTRYTRVLLPLGLIPRRRENVEPLVLSRGSGGFQRLGLRMGLRRKAEPGLKCGLLRPGFWKGPEDSQGCYLLDCWVRPAWRLLQGVRDTVTEELVREGIWAWFCIPVR